MSTTEQEAQGAAKPEGDSPWPQVRLSETDRLETFSDSVLSITLTLLVAEVVRPEHAPGQLLDRLTAQWPGYIAFLASFCYAGVIWLNHRAVFARVRYCDLSLHLANLFLLLTSQSPAKAWRNAHPSAVWKSPWRPFGEEQSRGAERGIMPFATHSFRPLHAICTAASQSSQINGSTGDPSAHFKRPIRSSISPAVLPSRRQMISRKKRTAS
jgi:hypothetical protein